MEFKNLKQRVSKLQCPNEKNLKHLISKDKKKKKIDFEEGTQKI